MARPVPAAASLLVQDIIVQLYATNVYEVIQPVQDDKFLLTNKVLCNTTQSIKAMLWYKFSSKRYLYKAATDCSETDYTSRLLVGLELFNALNIINSSGGKVPQELFAYDISIPSRTLNGITLPNNLYTFDLYFSKIPSDYHRVQLLSVDISTGKQAVYSFPLSYEKIFSNSRDRNIISIKNIGKVEYTVPFNTSTGEFGSYYSSSLDKIKINLG